ncbi:hypothetical protein [Herbiconiux sp. VKM Ac-2851]|uniref:hypothetical protein n=1 Tax=Herbiconiux sp. VKM Ac-2851 TaxID=2739025 RepID=UPI0015639B2D|nr:hypothetical protein [Herbiconiux sp. VKM Ac-2851]NQX37144.1 hypothetical protein [Herbiconiux sp. VKM Ac-2851]
MTTSSNNAVEVIEIASSGWRLRDRSRQESDSRGLLGFVEADGNGFDAVWLTPAITHEHFDTLEAALQTASSLCNQQSQR